MEAECLSQRWREEQGRERRDRQNKERSPGLVGHVCKSNTCMAEAGGVPLVQGQTGLHSETLTQTNQ